MKRLLAIFTLCSIFFCSCEKSEMKSRDIFAMDTYMNLKACGKNADTALDSAEQEIRRLESIFSVTDENSEIYRLNNSYGKKTDVSDDTSNIIKFSKEMGNATNGCLDISVYPLVKEWGFTTGDYKIPEKQRISKLLTNVDYTRISIDENTVNMPENMKIDLGAVAKGYTADKIVGIFEKNAIESALINLGGNVYALGKKPDGTSWSVAIANPLVPDEIIGKLEVCDKAVVTSGNYQRYFTDDNGRNYCHIIDPSTGYHAENGLISVTVTGSSGAECDALSTALFVMGKDEAESYLNNHKDISAIMVENNGNIIISENLSSDFESFADSVEVLRGEN